MMTRARRALIPLLTLAIGTSSCTKKEEEVARPAIAAPLIEPEEAYVGSEVCASCHGGQHEKWLGSHHDLAMQRATEETVLGNFSDATEKYFTETNSFTRDGDQFFVEALGADGESARFPVKYTFGVEPLQQYLVETEPGRLQSFPFAWDTRPQGDGGQRWFHLQPDEYVEPGDPIHWTGLRYNWNNACADCHSTALEKNYDRASKTYATEYFEVNVGCEACHGAGREHVRRAESDLPMTDTGFERHFTAPADREWKFVEGKDIATLTRPEPTDELETCAPCHSRRADLGGEFTNYHDRYRLAALDELLYFADGQIQDEVYVYGSFLQSKMHAAGVVCTDCHDPHSAELRADGNALCTRCHKASVYDGPQHSFHPTGTPGSSCTDCHMPERTYMLIDERADHRFGIPRPALSESVGAADVCTSCHANRNAAWAERQIAIRFKSRSPHGFGEILSAARHQQPGAEAGLIELVAAGTAPAIVRATAILELRILRSRALPALLMRAVSDPSPVVRRSVAVAARELPFDARTEIVLPLLPDPARSVRIEAATSLLGANTEKWPPSDRKALGRARSEYKEARTYSADRGDGLVDLAHVAMTDRDPKQAEALLREAIDTDPNFTAAYVNLADLYRSLGRNDDSQAILETALERAADRATTEHAMGLALVRLGQHDEALAHLRRAHELRPESIRFGFVYSVAQFDQDKQDAALKTLDALHHRYPANLEILNLLVNYNRQLGRERAAARYVAKLSKLGASPQ